MSENIYKKEDMQILDKESGLVGAYEVEAYQYGIGDNIERSSYLYCTLYNGSGPSISIEPGAVDNVVAMLLEYKRQAAITETKVKGE